MSVLLDSDICIGIIREKLPKAIAKVRSMDVSEVFLCSVVKFELLFGVECCDRPLEELAKVKSFSSEFKSLPFDDECAKEAASIRRHLESNGIKIGAYDTQIAAIAITHDLTLITNNNREFQRVPNLRVENWES
jgi:tRNA(fMet)-specific endonuclease VapC